MIGSSFLASSSPFNSDIFGGREDLSNAFPFDLDVFAGSVESFGDWDQEQASGSTSPVHSSCSEECEWPTFDNALPSTVEIFESDLLKTENTDVSNIEDPTNTPLFNVLKEETVNSHSSDSINNTQSQPRVKRKKNLQLPGKQKSWSRMTSEERFNTTDALSKIISQQLGLSDQIEVIKIIDPSVVLSPYATEFAIDLTQLNDNKLRRIKQYIKKHKHHSSCQNKTIANNIRNTLSGPPGKRKTKKYTPSYLRDLKIREQKFVEQDIKEKQSGLFSNETIIKKLCNPMEEDEDVNILE